MFLPEELFRGSMKAMMNDSNISSPNSPDSTWMSLKFDDILVTIDFPTSILTDDHWKCKVCLFSPTHGKSEPFDARYFAEITAKILFFKAKCRQSQ